MTQLVLTILNNRNLFSSHYLESLIKDHSEWKEDVNDAFNQTKKIYNSRTEWNRMGESMLEEFLIRPILKNVLEHHFVPQAKVEQNAKRPDYAFFENENDLNEALKNNGTDDFYLKATALGEAKSWKTLLDKKIKGVKASFEFQNPSFQIDYYLHVTPVQWGILTNGHHWRLYNKETSYKLDSYYEIDLATILEKNDIEGFKYFYLFFRLEALRKDASGKNFLDRVNEGSLAYAKKLGNNLQKNIYESMELLSKGFLSYQDNALTNNENDLKEVQENTLKLLYRLLFIFFAESRKLLDIDNPEYKKLSLESIKYDIANKKDSGERILSVTTDYWNKLNTLFALINEGSESERFKIPKDIFYIPAYNGGLFDPKRNPFLHSKKIGDEFIAKAINLMAREEKEFIDYSTLGTRQLGSIYEGLLEYKLKVATEDLAAVKEKGYEKWIPKKEAEGKKSFFEIKAGEIYLATDKGERKATGSYYTPDYIVKYIVRNTLGPILDEKRRAWKEKGLGEYPFLHEILGVRVLDPAMGSGHFLVEACEFLANKLVEAWGEARPEDLESEEVAEHDVHWARREVVRNCIFGVDLNPMAVELAKLSLWDFTVKKHFEELLAKYGEFAAHPDDDLKSVKQKEQEYDALQKSEINRRLHELANVWVSTYFGAAPLPDEYAEMQNEMNPKDFQDWSKWRAKDWFTEAQRIADEKRFFHWELEFPESFYEKGAPKDNPGWDAVVGNPPYVRQEQLGSNKEYFKLNYEVYHSAADLYAYFFECGHRLLRHNGKFGFISSNKFMRSNYGATLRTYLKEKTYLREIVDFADDPKSNEIIKPVIAGEDIKRYEIDFTDKYLIWTYIGVNIDNYPAIIKHLKQYQEHLEKRYDKGNYWWELRACDYYPNFEKQKIVLPDISQNCKFAIDTDKLFSINTTYIIPVADYYLLSILNSSLTEYFYKSQSAVFRGGYLRFIYQYLERIPIRRISFTTPSDRRATLVEEAKALYSAFVSAPDRDDPAFKCGDFVGVRLSAAPEESDVVHDLLAYLAEHMIEMNKDKNAEIKSFLSFLEGEISAPINELTNKTAIQKYYEHEFSGTDKDKLYFIDVLVKNKKKLKAGYDPKSPTNYKHLQEWHRDSVGKLALRLKMIEATDKLIDAIVYRLYGLTEDEIKIVEESISGKSEV